jgi:hypothetical protein
MEGRDITVGERRDRDRWSQHVHLLLPAAPHRVVPAVEAEGQQAGPGDQPRLLVVVDDHATGGQAIDLGPPQEAIAGPVEALASSQALSGETPIQVLGAGQLLGSLRPRHGLLVPEVLRRAAQSTGPVPGGEGDCVIEEEERCPSPRCGEWLTLAPELGHTGDPEPPAMMKRQLALIVDETTPVPGEHPS